MSTTNPNDPDQFTPRYRKPGDCGFMTVQRLQFVTRLGDLDIWFDPEEDGSDLHYLVIGPGDLDDWADATPGHHMFLHNLRDRFAPAEEFIRNLMTLGGMPR